MKSGNLQGQKRIITENNTCGIQIQYLWNTNTKTIFWNTNTKTIYVEYKTIFVEYM